MFESITNKILQCPTYNPDCYGSQWSKNVLLTNISAVKNRRTALRNALQVKKPNKCKKPRKSSVASWFPLSVIILWTFTLWYRRQRKTSWLTWLQSCALRSITSDSFPGSSNLLTSMDVNRFSIALLPFAFGHVDAYRNCRLSWDSLEKLFTIY